MSKKLSGRSIRDLDDGSRASAKLRERVLANYMLSTDGTNIHHAKSHEFTTQTVARGSLARVTAVRGVQTIKVLGHPVPVAQVVTLLGDKAERWEGAAAKNIKHGSPLPARLVRLARAAPWNKAERCLSQPAASESAIIERLNRTGFEVCFATRPPGTKHVEFYTVEFKRLQQLIDNL